MTKPAEGGEWQTEYRVVWKRVGLKPKRKRYVTRAKAERFMAMFGPEPWKVYAGSWPNGTPKTGDDLACCIGRECGCGGKTLREQSEEQRAAMPALEYLRLESRAVGGWSEVAS